MGFLLNWFSMHPRLREHSSVYVEKEQREMDTECGRNTLLAPRKDSPMSSLSYVYRDDRGQSITEYAVMLAVVLVLVVGTIRLIGSNANNTFSSVASSIQ